VVACGLAAAAAATGGATLPVDGLAFDLVIAARAAVFPPSDPPDQSPVAVLALDEGSLADDAIRPYPRTFLAPVWATVVDAMFRAGARVVGFDILFAYSTNEFARLVPALADYDQPFLATLYTHRERIVLARSERTAPADALVAAVGAGDDDLGFIQIEPDADDRYRHLTARHGARPHGESGRAPRGGSPEPAQASSDGSPVATLMGLVLARAGVSRVPATVTLAPRRHLEAIPTYALADVYRCAARAPDALARAFAGKVVLVGTTHPDEDRKVSSGRFLTAPRTPVTVHPCGLRRLAASVPQSDTVPGVFLHAEAVAEVLGDRVVSEVPRPVTVALPAATAATGAMLAATAGPLITVVATIILAAGLFAVATVALAHDVWIPLALPMIALCGAPAVTYVVRYLVEERSRRWLQHAFGHYVAPALVDRLLDDTTALKLGGERREVTVMFADLSGFTALSGKVDAQTLTAKTNEYLAYIVEHVEATGGYVDKFIGDAVMALWGAPAADPGHAVSAVTAAMAAAARVAEEQERAHARGEIGFAVKIGINSGDVVVGNVGTRHRYNYTAVGETVNVASRLESVPGLYGCRIVVGERTAELAREAILFRELDRVRVKGRDLPLSVFEPIARRASATAADQARVRAYADALTLYRGLGFDEAVQAWTALADVEGKATPPDRMAERARALALNPPEAGWHGVREVTSK
jgi:adenylate cyclase/guanylate cyclase